MSEWYEYDTSAKRILFLMMERSKRPLSITAYKFTDVSLESFVAVKSNFGGHISSNEHVVVL